MASLASRVDVVNSPREPFRITVCISNNGCSKGKDKFRDCVQMIGKGEGMGDEIGGLVEIDEMVGL